MSGCNREEGGKERKEMGDEPLQEAQMPRTRSFMPSTPRTNPTRLAQHMVTTLTVPPKATACLNQGRSPYCFPPQQSQWC